ncbi:hypothetical protein F5Y04DRAFT_290290 [Hypomontagnella monticulosa]|nr:hypothetical protein F5Y04DRAFT_290290 [Hypomontagnella monticulosa]
MATWNSLPIELRLVVYQNLDYTDRRRPQGQDIRHKHCMTKYAAVSREWQAFFEQRNFKRLTIRQQDLEEFERIFKGYRRRWLRILWMRVQLPRYRCPECNMEETEGETGFNSSLFTSTIWKLFTILSTWDRENPLPFTLMLSVYSPSDNEHHFRTHCFGDDLKTFYMGPRLPLSDFEHGWWLGRQHAPRLEAKLRVLGKPLKFLLTRVSADPDARLPTIRLVSALVLPRQFYRRIPNVDVIIRSLPNLQDFRYEQWRPVTGRGVANAFVELRDIIQALPYKLERISIFEDFNDALHPRALHQPGEHDLISAQLLRRLSHELIDVNASFIMDGCDFFEFDLQRSWPRLELLTLTCKILRRDSLERDDLFIAAAKAAMFMPKLRMLQL